MPKYIQQFSVLKDELTLYVPPAGVIPVLTFLRDHSQCQFKACMDISGVDFPERDKRFEVVYHLLSVKYGGRIRVKTYAGETDPVPSAVPVFSGADWYATPFVPYRIKVIELRLGTRERFGTCTVSSSRGILICASVSLDIVSTNRIFSLAGAASLRTTVCRPNSCRLFARIDGAIGFEGHPLRKDFPLTVRLHVVYLIDT